MAYLASFPGTKPVYYGHDGFREFWKHLHEPWEDVHVEIESYAREGEVAILRIRFHGTSKASGVTVDLPWFQAIVIENDLVVRSALDRMVGDALEALDVGRQLPGVLIHAPRPPLRRQGRLRVRACAGYLELRSRAANALRRWRVKL